MVLNKRKGVSIAPTPSAFTPAYPFSQQHPA